jgi:hypothetical protein
LIAHAVADKERNAVWSYIRDGLRTIMRGAYDWDQRAGRYKDSFIIPAGHPGYAAELG